MSKTATGNWRPYVVKRGDYLDKIAFCHGIEADRIRAYPRNELLRRERQPDLLCPGDIVYVPAPNGSQKESLAIGSNNVFVREVPSVKITVRILKLDRTPYANQSCQIEGLPPLLTDGDGLLSFQVPVVCHAVRIELTELLTFVDIEIGELDPHTERSGMAQRLENLGFYCNSEASSDDLDGAMEQFRRRFGLPGESADGALKRVHGS